MFIINSKLVENEKNQNPSFSVYVSQEPLRRNECGDKNRRA
jgi:hypothetical protein